MTTIQIQTATDQQLVQWLADATTTASMCGGHGKTARNRELKARYTEELTRRKVVIPSYEDLQAAGHFNGEGAS